ncbi:WD40 repeat-like protein [Gonapodya prolifera JEL478]|uniref:WD40 repeat-like protein n=1 Tax=Gonapodya prolifera (strain JEL478) TaxID=1344416 RepID=A0A139B015_GONPJ|nr:WD40 repeat-like protein [Gonapodya prolifera JEL478]|eukprot:KXS22143.1 WD40 repeat-like protein [Gonapodya prolifera JEL478]
MLQALSDMGYNRSAQRLEQESGYLLRSPDVARFRDCVRSGDWAGAESYLPSLGVSGNNLMFLIRRQKYLELLELQQIKDALVVLRTELTPLGVQTNHLHQLSSLIMCSNVEDLMAVSQWDGASGESRNLLLVELQRYISTSVMIPERRLETLLEQAVQLQKQMCLYHNYEEHAVSLYCDHMCKRSQFPCKVTHVLQEHTDEVWYVTFSHSGSLLASSGKDTTAIIWDARDGRSLYVLAGHKDVVSFVAFSPDDTILLSCSNDKTVAMWDVETGVRIRELALHNDFVTACAWLPDGKHFVTGGLDKNVHIWSAEGDVEMIHTISGNRVTDLAVTPDGKWLVVVCHEKKIRIYDFATRQDAGILNEEDHITSLCLAADSRHALVNLASQEIHLWDLRERRLVRKYEGHKQGRFVIRSCLGGSNGQFVASGSEDSMLYVWNRDQGVLIEAIPGHTATINAVASWKQRLATASDDHSIRIFDPPDDV